jgi:hypothetical protein
VIDLVTQSELGYSLAAVIATPKIGQLFSEIDAPGIDPPAERATTVVATAVTSFPCTQAPPREKAEQERSRDAS